MAKIFFISFLFSTLVCALDSGESKKKWTWLFFVAGDEAEIDPYSRVPVRKLEQVGTTADHWIVAHTDFHLNPYGTQKIKEPSRRYLIEKHPGSIHPKNFSTLRIRSPVVWKSEAEMSSVPTTALSDFVTWAVSKYPAEKYALFVLGHSWGWRGLGQDYDTGEPLPESPEGVTIPYLMASIEDFRASLSISLPEGRPWDLLVLDSCNDAILEILYRLTGLAHYVVATPTEMPFMSFDYGKTLSRPNLSAERLSEALVLDAIESFDYLSSQVMKEGGYPAVSLMALDLEKMFPFWEPWRALLKQLSHTNFKNLFLGEKFADWVDPHQYLDAIELLRELKEKSNDSSVQSLSSRLLELLDAPPEQNSLDRKWHSIDTERIDALTLYIPRDPYLNMEEQLKRADTYFDFLNPHLESIEKKWQPTFNGRLKVDFEWKDKPSILLRPFLPAAHWVEIVKKRMGSVVGTQRLSVQSLVWKEKPFSPLSPFVAVGHTLGAARHHGLSLSFDREVDSKLPENFNWNGTAWMGGKDYYRSLEFSKAFGWDSLLFE